MIRLTCTFYTKSLAYFLPYNKQFVLLQSEFTVPRTVPESVSDQRVNRETRTPSLIVFKWLCLMSMLV